MHIRESESAHGQKRRITHSYDKIVRYFPLDYIHSFFFLLAFEYAGVSILVGRLCTMQVLAAFGTHEWEKERKRES